MPMRSDIFMVAALRTEKRLIASLEVETSDEPASFPQLAVVAVKSFLCHLDCGGVVVGFDPIGRRDLIHPIEAIKPVVWHCRNSNC